MSKQFTINPKLDIVLERFIDAPGHLVWEALTKPEHLKEWYMPKPWGVFLMAQPPSAPARDSVRCSDSSKAGNGSSPIHATNMACDRCPVGSRAGRYQGRPGAAGVRWRSSCEGSRTIL